MTGTVPLIFMATQNFISAEHLRVTQRVRLNWSLTGISQRSRKKTVEEQKESKQSNLIL